MADQPISTSIDDLVKYLNEHGETDSSTISAALRVGESVVETWADVLEKAQIVKVSYKLGKMFVSPATTSREGAEAAKKTVDIKKDIAESELVAQVNMMNQLSAKLSEFQKSVTNAEGTFKSKAGSVKESLDQIDKFNLQMDVAYKKLKLKSDYIDSFSARLEKETQQLEEKAKAAGIATGRESDAKNALNDMKAKLDEYENRIKALNDNFSSTTEQNRRSFTELVNSIKEEDKVLRALLGEREKEVQAFRPGNEAQASRPGNAAQAAARPKNEAQKPDEKAKATGMPTGRESDAKNALNDMKAKLDDYENRIKTLNDNFSSTTEQNRRSFTELVNSIKEEDKALRESLGERAKEVQGYSSTLSSYKQESDSVKMQISREKARMLDDIAKATEEARRTYSVSEQRISEMKKTLAEMKSQFGGYADLSDQLNAIKNNIDSVSREKDEIMKELSELSDQFRALSAIEGSDIAAKSAKMQQLETKLADATRKINALDAKSDSVRNEMGEIGK